MFCLRIHSVSSPHRPPPEFTREEDSTGTSSSRNPKVRTRIQVLRGIVHLYRTPRSLSASSSDPFLPACRGTLLFVLAVPNHLSPEDFLRFCGSYADRSAAIQFIRSDGIEDRYSVLVKLEDQMSADAFYLNLNGWRFSSAKEEICHILFLDSVECTESAEIAGTPPVGSTELPTCPACIERLDQKITGLMSFACDHSFQCSCISKWTNSSCSVCQFHQKHSAKPICSLCKTSESLWICVICGHVGCGRYIKGHALKHWKDTQHCFTLDLETQMVWDYDGHIFAYRINQSKSDDEFFKQKPNCKSTVDHRESRAFTEDSVISGASLSSKVEAIVDEFRRLFVSQLENQRVYHETLLEDAKQKWERCISEAMDRAVGSKIQDIKLDIKKINENLTKSQNHWREKIEEIEQRTILSDMRSSHSSTSKDIKNHKIYCECNLQCITLTCYRDDNHGRKFYRCPRNRSEHDCNYFNWMDEVEDTLF